MGKNFKELDSYPAQRVFLLCEKCGMKNPINGENAARVLQQWMKSELKAHGLSMKLRPVVSSCLGICPEKSVTAALLSNEGEASHFYVLNLKNSQEVFQEILDEVLKDS